MNLPFLNYLQSERFSETRNRLKIPICFNAETSSKRVGDEREGKGKVKREEKRRGGAAVAAKRGGERIKISQVDSDRSIQSNNLNFTNLCVKLAAPTDFKINVSSVRVDFFLFLSLLFPPPPHIPTFFKP